MKLIEIMEKPFAREIVLVCGNLCSGKGHYCATYFPKYHKIEVSSVVKSLIKSEKRSDLSTTKHLDQQIVGIINRQIEHYEKVVVDGIRQMSILKGIQQEWGSFIKDIIWLDVPQEILKSRFEKRNAGKDDMSFDKALQSDKALGVGEVEDYIRNHHRSIPY